MDLEPGGILTLAAASPAEPTLKVRPPETAAASTLGSAPERAAVPQRLPESVQHPEAEVSLLALGIPVASPASIHAADLPDLSSSLSSSLAAVTVKPPALRGVGIGFAVAAACAVQGTAQLQLALPPLGLIASHMIEPESIAPAARLSGEQLQALPLQGRHWENFVLDTPVGRGGQGEDTPDTPQKSGRTPVSVTVDGASTRLAFGGRGGGTTRSSSLMGPGRNESAIGEVRTLEAGGEAGDSRNANLETRGGSIGLHGQGFLFDRQNFLGAQNPFTQWVKETAPATVTSIPVFTPLPYTAPDSEYIWGVGIGSRIPRRRVFWFAAFDGTHRDYPGVTMVKHPDNFFAQPSNDEMQVLSARLGLPAANPVGEGLGAYSGMLETLSGLLGPAPRTADQWVGFSRLDWQAAERHSFTLEGTGALWNSPGGGLTRTSEPYGSHSFGTSQASEFWLLGAVAGFSYPQPAGRDAGFGGPAHAQRSAGHSISLRTDAQRERVGAVAADGRGFALRFHHRQSKPIRDGQLSGRTPLPVARGSLMIKAGIDWQHNANATGMVRNHTGTYHYSTVENFASDALVFAKYGLTDALHPFNPHNCDERGKAWRHTAGQLHGLGYLPC